MCFIRLTLNLFTAFIFLFYYPTLWAKDATPITAPTYNTQPSPSPVIVYRKEQDTFLVPRCSFGNPQYPNDGQSVVASSTRSVKNVSCCPTNMTAHVEPVVTYIDSDKDNPNNGQGYAIAVYGLSGKITSTSQHPDNPNICDYNVTLNALMGLATKCANMQINANWSITCI